MASPTSEPNTEEFPFWPLIIGSAVLVFVLWGGGFLVLRYGLIGDWETRAQAGDTFGGITSLFSGLAFAGLIVTLWMQRHELRLQRLELAETRAELASQRGVMERQAHHFERQALETTFFQRLQHFETIIDGIDRQYRDYDSMSGETTINVQGRDALERVARTMRRATLFDNLHNEAEITEDGWQDRYNIIYEKLESDLGNYFRVLYNLLDYIDAQEGLTDAEKYGYIKIIRASLSPDELLLIFYNVTSDYSSDRMKALVERYALLKHLPRRYIDEAPFVASAYPDRAFGKPK